MVDVKNHKLRLFGLRKGDLCVVILVMDSAKVFSTNDGYSYLWTITWERINQFLPHLKEELFKSHPSVEGFESGTPGIGTWNIIYSVGIFKKFHKSTAVFFSWQHL
uniref:Golgi-specific brefeldin A-resistance guanine nucleotide exchange factor 1 n=1 Tax=Cacopsylla melanoneura TaxID=428564 RepID=A0A8D8VPR3_9HEMI